MLAEKERAIGFQHATGLSERYIGIGNGAQRKGNQH